MTTPSGISQESKPLNTSPLPIDAKLSAAIRKTKKQLARWGLLDDNAPSQEWTRNIDALIPTTDATDLAQAINVAMSIEPGEDWMLLSHQRRLLAITVIHALEEIDALRAESRRSSERTAGTDDTKRIGFIVSTYHGPVGGGTEEGVVVRLCVDDRVEVEPAKGNVARLSAFSACGLAYSLLDFAIQPFAGDIARRAVESSLPSRVSPQ